MEIRLVDGLTLYFEADERETADLVEQASRQSLQLIRQCWGLDTPEGCRVYVMTSWRHFLFHSAPWPRKILMGLLMPLWAFRARKIWPYSGGWTLPYRRPAVGVKPPRLIEVGDTSIGARVFVKEGDLNEKVRHVTCHELVHAFSAHLKLPMWLNEGLAMVTVDRLLQKATVKTETLEVLAPSSGKVSPRGYREISVSEQETFVYAFVRGYWITRYLEETRPELLKSLLAQRISHQALESRVAAACGMEREEFWQEIDSIAAAHFGSQEVA